MDERKDKTWGGSGRGQGRKAAPPRVVGSQFTVCVTGWTPDEIERVTALSLRYQLAAFKRKAAPQ